MILENLLENAIHFGTPEGCEIMMKATEGEGYIQIKISDNGPGIPKEYQEQVFEMYFRGSERSRGNGLGLYIVKKAVEKLNGTVRMETEWGRGTTFIVTLPQG
jgi:signal transduction histidine kinase